MISYNVLVLQFLQSLDPFFQRQQIAHGYPYLSIFVFVSNLKFNPPNGNEIPCPGYQTKVYETTIPSQ